MLTHNSNGRVRGFSLVEVMVSIMILGVGFAAMAQLHRTNVDGSIYARQSSAATVLAQKKLAVLSSQLSAARSGTEVVQDGGLAYTLTWIVSEASDGTTRVNVSVVWPDGSSKSDNTITLAAVAQDYVPDQAFRNLKIIPGSPPETLEDTFTKFSNSSAATSNSTTLSSVSSTTSSTTTTSKLTPTTTTSKPKDDDEDEDDDDDNKDKDKDKKKKEHSDNGLHKGQL